MPRMPGSQPNNTRRGVCRDADRGPLPSGTITCCVVANPHPPRPYTYPRRNSHLAARHEHQRQRGLLDGYVILCASRPRADWGHGSIAAAEGYLHTLLGGPRREQYLPRRRLTGTPAVVRDLSVGVGLKTARPLLIMVFVGTTKDQEVAADIGVDMLSGRRLRHDDPASQGISPGSSPVHARAFRAESLLAGLPRRTVERSPTYRGRHSRQDAAAAGPSSVGMPMAVRDDIRTFAVEHLSQADAMPSLPNHG